MVPIKFTPSENRINLIKLRTFFAKQCHNVPATTTDRCKLLICFVLFCPLVRSRERQTVFLIPLRIVSYTIKTLRLASPHGFSLQLFKSFFSLNSFVASISFSLRRHTSLWSIAFHHENDKFAREIAKFGGRCEASPFGYGAKCMHAVTCTYGLITNAVALFSIQFRILL